MQTRKVNCQKDLFLLDFTIACLVSHFNFPNTCIVRILLRVGELNDATKQVDSKID